LNLNWDNKIKIIKIIIVSILSVLILLAAYLLLIQGNEYYSWNKGLSGYKKAQQLSQSANSSMLIYIRKQNCFYCDQFEKDFLRDALVQVQLDPYIKVKIQASDDDEYSDFNKKFPVNKYPALFIKKSPQHPAVSIHVLMQTSQVWVSKPTHKRGNFMPISNVTLPIAIQSALIESEALGQK